MSPRVLVLGAGGFIGRRVIAALAASGWAQPIAAGRHPASLPRGDGIERLALDATEPARLAPAIEGAGTIVNCVAGSPETIARGAHALFETAARSASPPRIIHLSSLAVYGSVCGEVDEATPLSGTRDAYGEAKLEAERVAAQYARAVILRPGIVYGPGSPWWSDRIARLLMGRRLGDLGAAAQGVCNLVHVEDVATAVLRSAQASAIEGQVFNLSLPQPPTWNEYFRLYAEALGAVPLRRISPARLALELRVWGPALKVAQLLSRADAATPPLRPWLLKLCRHNITMRARLIEQALGLAWTPLDRGLAGTAAWFLQGQRAA